MSLTMNSAIHNQPNPPAPARTQDEIRAHVHGVWATVADNWRQHANYIDTRAGEVAEKLLDLAGLVRGNKVLELACGPGGLGIAAAERVGPAGYVVLSDIVAEMTDIAVARAAKLGLGNI